MNIVFVSTAKYRLCSTLVGEVILSITTMDSVQAPSPIPSDGSFPFPLSTNYLLVGSLSGSGNMATLYSTGMHRQMVRAVLSQYSTLNVMG